ncbi:hypothetical protein H4R20_002747 [Coemansia guatemalensis]|uniref:Uncharacterized protein n=1 Tax=Coemansia guatemalensis TaxID=2761395 RepID=A0A9W8HUX7_9FUNG|nr:hypothetical protein H4R20_002747 [Coemansia guatemalensis]
MHDVIAGEQDQHQCDSAEHRQGLNEVHQEICEGRHQTDEINAHLGETSAHLDKHSQTLRNLEGMMADLMVAVQKRNSCPASPARPVVQSERNEDSPVMQVIAPSMENPPAMPYTGARHTEPAEFVTLVWERCPTGSVSRFRGVVVEGEGYSHEPMEMPIERRAEHASYSDEVEDEEWVSRDSCDAFCTPHANFSTRSRGEVGFTLARAGRSSHHAAVESPREDTPARQVHPQMTDERSGRAPAGPVPMNDGQYHQNGKSATAGLYPTDVISNGEDTVLNVASEIFMSQYGDLIEGHFLMFHTDWTRHMETERHADQCWKNTMYLLSKTHRRGILESLVPELMARLIDRRSDATPLTITGRPLGKPTATFGMGKDTDTADSITYVQAIESYMGTNRLDYDWYGMALLAGNTTTLYCNAYFNLVRPFGDKITWRKAVFYFLKATPASLTTDEVQWIMSRIILTAEQPLPEFVNNFLLLWFRTGNHMRLSKVMDYLFRAVGVPMEMMLRTHMHHDPDHHLELYNLLEVLAGAEQEHNHYRAAATSEQVTQDHIDKYAAATSMQLRGTGAISLGARVLGPNRAPTRGHSAPGPPTKLAVAALQPCPPQHFEDRRSGQQRNQGWRQNPSHTQQLRGNFAPRSHQTAPVDGGDAETGSAPREHYAEDTAPVEEVVNHQTEIPDAQYDNSEMWMEYDADAIEFEHEDDYLSHWPASTAHHVQISDGNDEAVADGWLRTLEFDWCAEPLTPQLADAMGAIRHHSLEVVGPTTHQAVPTDDKHRTLLAELGKVDRETLSGA